MKGLLGIKKGMTQIYDQAGQVVPVTVIEAGPCVVTQIKTQEKDGYTAVQVGFGTAKKINKPLLGHLKGQKLKHLVEFRMADYQLGQEIKADLFKAGDIVAVSGVSRGMGFAGTVKRHHFSRGPMAHGSKSHRLPGSIGAGTTPGRVLPGTRMSGRMGGEKVTVKNLKVVQVDPQRNLILVKGAVPGTEGSLLMIWN